jgi:hypothetical protein
MSQLVRQSNLFAGEDWLAIYRAFSEVNFNSYDFDTIRAAMKNYIQINYPENFNDWIDASEFVAMIDLLAYLGEALAFRMDFDSRDNFISDAVRRSSILNLATFLSYNPSRNSAAQGLLKLVQVSTDQNIVDSLGINLTNTSIIFNDANNPDWMEQFFLILNAAFQVDNPFGQPNNSGTVAGIATQSYAINSSSGNGIKYSFNATADSTSTDFEVVNTAFTDGGTYYELDPDPANPFYILYLNDGNGYSSPNTGFMVLFKQGTLQYTDIQIDNPLDNRTIAVNIDNINNTDVFVSSIETSGTVITQWTQVPSVFEDNIVFNNISQSIQNIYSVITEENDQISVRFADSSFGAIPTGIIRIWTRVSNGLVYTINPTDIQNIEITVSYISTAGLTQNLTLTFSLEQSVSNSAPSETNASIQTNAPQIYYTRNRMVNGQDYNVFPLSSTLVAKVHAINRTYSGHDPFININDPTANYHDSKVFSDDGIIFTRYNPTLAIVIVTATTSPEQIVVNYIQPALEQVGLSNFFYRNFQGLTQTAVPAGNAVVWYQVSNPLYSSTGYFNSLEASPWTPSTTYNANASFVFYNTVLYKCIVTHTSGPAFTPANWVNVYGGPAVGSLMTIDNDSVAVDFADYLQENVLVKFKSGGWAKISSVTNNGDGVLATGYGTVQLSTNVSTNDYIVEIIPAFDTTLNATEIAAIEAQLAANNTFGIRYDITSDQFVIILGSNLNQTGAFDLSTAGSTGLNSDSSWLIMVVYTGQSFQITTRAQDYVFESTKDVRFFFASEFKTVDFTTGLDYQDSIEVLPVNTQPLVDGIASNLPIGGDFLFQLVSLYTYPDGYNEPRRVVITFWDSNNSGVPDDPEAFDNIVGDIEENNPNYDWYDNKDKVVFYSQYTDQYGYEYYAPNISVFVVDAVSNGTNIDLSAPTSPWWYLYNDETLTSYLVLLKDQTNTAQNGIYVFNVSTELFTPYVNSAPTVVFEIYNKIFWTVNTVTNIWTNPAEGLYLYEYGRNNLYFLWKHYAPFDHRIDPAITNIIDIYVLTVDYDQALRNWIATGGSALTLPAPPTETDLALALSGFNNYKMISDQIVWRPAVYQLLFGAQAEPELQAQFEAVLVQGATMSAGQVQIAIIQAIDNFFALSNWDFGDTFYFTEMAAYIHNQLATQLASIVLVPTYGSSKFGTLFQIKAETNQIFISCAEVSDVVVVNNLSASNIRIGN